MRKRAASLLFFAVFCVTAKAQCPQFEQGSQVGTVAHNSLDEISGIAASRQNSDVFWVHNDKGGQARVFAMNRQGTHLGIYNLSGADDEDYEDIAIGPGPTPGVDYLYVGNIGDNNGRRINIKVYRVAEPVVDSNQSPIETTLTGIDTITLVYPDGARNAEALMVDPATKDIYIASKKNNYFRVYRAPYPQSTTSTITMEYKCQVPWYDKVSAGDISINGSMIIIRNDDGNASIWLRPEGTDLWDAFSGTECTVQLMSEVNGEAVCFDANGCGYYTTSEGSHQPIHYYARDGRCPAEPIPQDCDIDGDGKVDSVDYSILALQWHQAPGVPSADIVPFTGNGIVNVNDFSFFVDNWLWSESAPE